MCFIYFVPRFIKPLFLEHKMRSVVDTMLFDLQVNESGLFSLQASQYFQICLFSILSTHLMQW